MTISYEKSRTTNTFVILDSSVTLVSELFKDGLLLLAVKGSVIAEWKTVQRHNGKKNINARVEIKCKPVIRK